MDGRRPEFSKGRFWGITALHSRVEEARPYFRNQPSVFTGATYEAYAGTCLAHALLALGVLSAFCLAGPVSPTATAQAPKAAATASLPAGVERVTSVEGITEYRMANGLQILLFPDPTKETITVNVTYLVGSSHENYGETGMAHLLEHLVFKGTPKHPNIAQELTEHGSRPNGTTWTDRTNYFETFAATDANLEWALDLESDRMVNSFIAKKDLDSEMTVVRNEFEAGENSPFGVLLQRTMATAYLWHNYGKTTIGARSDIENVPIDRLQAFYKRYYQPDNAVLLVAGRFDEPKTLALIHKYFSPIPRPTRVLDRIYTVEPTQDGERSVTLRRVGDTQYVAALYHVPSGAHEEFGAIDILSQVLADTPSGRLHKALVEAKKASSIFGFGFQWREPTLAVFAAEVRVGSSLDTARDTLLETIEGLGTTPPTREEVERARAQLLKEIELNLNRSDLIGLTMSEFVGAGDWRLFFLHRDRVRNVTVEDVQKVAAQVLQIVEQDARSVHPDQAARAGGDPGDTGRRGDAEGLQGRCRDRRRRSIRSFSVEHREPDVAKRHGDRIDDGAAPEEDARRNRGGSARASIRGRKEPDEPHRRRLARRLHAHARHDEADASADSGRARPVEGAHERLRRRDSGQCVDRDHAREPARRAPPARRSAP